MRRDGLGQKVPMAILSNEAFSQNLELLGSAILRQSKFHISAKKYSIDLTLSLLVTPTLKISPTEVRGVTINYQKNWVPTIF